MKISPLQLRQIIQEVINEESIAEGGLKGMKELFGEFENDVMELAEEGQVHIDDIITMFKGRYEPMGLGPEDMNGMMDIMIEAGLLTHDADSGFYTTPDEQESGPFLDQGDYEHADQIASQDPMWDDWPDEEEEDDTHWGPDTEMTVGGTNYHLKKDDDEDLYEIIKQELSIALEGAYNMTNPERDLDIEYVMATSGYKPATEGQLASASDMDNRQYKISMYTDANARAGYVATAKDVNGKTWVKVVSPEMDPDKKAIAAELQKLEFEAWEAPAGDIVDLGTYDPGGSAFR